MIKGYYSRLSETRNNNEVCTDEIVFGYYVKNSDGDFTSKDELAEIYMRWYNIGKEKLFPRLEVWGSGFQTLSLLSNLFQEMQTWSKNFSPKEFSDLLDEYSFQDITAKIKKQ